MKLLGVERDGPFVQKWWLHNGDDNKDRITFEKIQDCEPIIKKAKTIAQGSRRGEYLGSIPSVIVGEFCRENATAWNSSPREVLAELITAKTDRAKAAWTNFMKGRDYRKLQAKNYQ